MCSTVAVWIRSKFCLLWTCSPVRCCKYSKQLFPSPQSPQHLGFTMQTPLSPYVLGFRVPAFLVSTCRDAAPHLQPSVLWKPCSKLCSATWVGMTKLNSNSHSRSMQFSTLFKSFLKNHRCLLFGLHWQCRWCFRSSAICWFPLLAIHISLSPLCFLHLDGFPRLPCMWWSGKAKKAPSSWTKMQYLREASQYSPLHLQN